MDDDLINLILWIGLAVIGIVGSVVKNIKKKRNVTPVPQRTNIPEENITERKTGPEREIRTLFDMINMEEPQEPAHTYESVESGPSVEEEGMYVDTPDATMEWEGMKNESIPSETGDQKETILFEEGKSSLKDYSKMDLKNDDITTSAYDLAEGDKTKDTGDDNMSRFFDARKAIIYSEILKRREF